jgi:hypothetical protein
VNGIDIKQLDLKPFKILEFLFANPFKKCIFKHLISNKCIIMSFIKENEYHMKKEKIL